LVDRKAWLTAWQGESNAWINPRETRSPDEPASGGAGWEDAPQGPDFDRTDGDQALLDQGLRLNRAFISIQDSLVREAIVNLAIEAANNEKGEPVGLPAESRTKTDPERRS
jgi:hypothetical protein